MAAAATEVELVAGTAVVVVATALAVEEVMAAVLAMAVEASVSSREVRSRHSPYHRRSTGRHHRTHDHR